MELDIEEYINMLNSEWILLQDHNILWTSDQFITIRDNNKDLLNNDVL